MDVIHMAFQGCPDVPPPAIAGGDHQKSGLLLSLILGFFAMNLFSNKAKSYKLTPLIRNATLAQLARATHL